MDHIGGSPPPYSRLDEETPHQTPPSGAPELGPRPPASSDYHLTEAKNEESNVTISFGGTTPPKGSMRFALKGFLCGCSLRSGCITVAVLYALYLIFFTAISISFFIVTYVEDEKPSSLSAIWGLNVAMFECCMAAFIIGFISIGIHKKKPVRLHVAKWLMMVDLCLNLLEEIHIALLVNIYGLIIHLVMQVIPIYFVLVVHSYEAQLRTEVLKKEPPRNDGTDTLPSST